MLGPLPVWVIYQIYAFMIGSGWASVCTSWVAQLHCFFMESGKHWLTSLSLMMVRANWNLLEWRVVQWLIEKLPTPPITHFFVVLFLLFFHVCGCAFHPGWSVDHARWRSSKFAKLCGICGHTQIGIKLCLPWAAVLEGEVSASFRLAPFQSNTHQLFPLLLLKKCC